jgi:hypothetical protein
MMDKKYHRARQGGLIEWRAAYHMDGVRDLVSLKNGDVASVLNADSYNAYGASK